MRPRMAVGIRLRRKDEGKKGGQTKGGERGA